MKLNKTQKEQVARFAKQADLSFVRIFGSHVSASKNPRDLDLFVSNPKLTFVQHATFCSGLSKIFNCPVDLVRPSSQLSPALVNEIARYSIPIWESKNGLNEYAVIIDRLLAVAQEQNIKEITDLKQKAIKKVQRRLSGTPNRKRKS